MAEEIQTSDKAKNILGQLISQGLNPRQDNILKTILKGDTKNAEEFLQQTGSSEESVLHLLKQFKIPTSEKEAVQQISSPESPSELVNDPRNVSQSSQAQTKSQPGNTQGNQLLNVLSMLIPGIGREQSAQLDRQKQRQELSGQLPIQQKDIDAKLIQGQIDLVKDQAKSGSLTANNIFKSYEPVATNFQGIVDSFARVQASVEDPSAAGDLALIFNFMKILDPDSVVRESEFATAQNAGGVDDRTRGLYNRIIDGKRLSTRQRKDFETRAGKLFHSKERQFSAARKNFQDIARKNGIQDTDKIIRDIKLVGKNAIDSLKTPSGVEFKILEEE